MTEDADDVGLVVDKRKLDRIVAAIVDELVDDADREVVGRYLQEHVRFRIQRASATTLELLAIDDGGHEDVWATIPYQSVRPDVGYSEN
jgi:hypothetical protein